MQELSRPVFLDDPRSLTAEAYRVLRNHLHYAMPRPRSVLITSAEMGAGKSSVTVNLGISLAQADHSVLLVDADLRRPVLHTLLQVPNALGLSSYLVGTGMPEGVVTRTSVPGLSLIPSGPSLPNPSDLLLSQRMRELLRAVAEQYDVVLVDSPPVLAVSDATALAPVVDGIVLVIGSTVPEAVVRRATAQLAAVHGRILGAVVNQHPAPHAGHRVLDGLARVPQAAARLSAPRRAVVTVGVEVAARSRRGLDAARQVALSGLAGVTRACAVGLESAARGATAVTAEVAAGSRRGLDAVRGGALGGLTRASQAWGQGRERAGRRATAFRADMAVGSRRGLDAARRGAVSALASAAQAWALGRERAGRAVTALRAEVAAGSRHGLDGAGRGAASGLAAPRMLARRLESVGLGMSELGAAAAARSRRGLSAVRRGALGGFSGASREWALRLALAGREVRAQSVAATGRSRHGLRVAKHEALNAMRAASRAAARLGQAGLALAALDVAVAELGQRHLRQALSGLIPARKALASGHGLPARAVGILGSAIAGTIQRPLGLVREGAWRTATTAVGGFAAGLALVLLAAGLLGRSGAPPARPPQVVATAAAKQAAPVIPTPAPTPPSVQPVSGAIVASGPPVSAAPGSPPEVVAIRYGVIDRQRPDWKWSWRVTVYKPNEDARVNARIEYIELKGSTRRLVGYEELCGLRLAGGRLQSIEGFRSISAAESLRISTVTATLSAAPESADATECRPRSSWVKRVGLAPLIAEGT